MKCIESLAVTHSRVGALLSSDAAAVRGQLSALGFIPCDASDADIDWLVTDGSGEVATAGKPLLRVPSRISVFHLRQAIMSLFNGEKG